MSKPVAPRASVRDLRNNFAHISAWLDAGREVEITKRGCVVAMLVPVEKPKRKRFDAEAHRKWMKDLFGDKVFMDNVVTEVRREKDW
jgi:antitoxin (DNA-binding transcriptional repressor) of toxin-antitoxin stability system